MIVVNRTVTIQMVLTIAPVIQDTDSALMSLLVMVNDRCIDDILCF